MTNWVRKKWMDRFSIKPTSRRKKMMNDKLCQQLSGCQSDEARRIILGVGRKKNVPCE